MTLEMIIATLEWPGWKECIHSWLDTANDLLPFSAIKGKTILEAYQQGFEESTADILGYLHDDVMVYEKAWNSRTLKEFDNPRVGIVGWGGAIGHGHPSMYSVPYELPQLARQYFISNMRSAEKHGSRFIGERDVSVIDGFAIFVRRELIEKIGGWTGHGPIGYYLYTEYLCCMARRLGYRIRLVGIDCDHMGGKSSGRFPPQPFDFEGEHRWLYDNFQDVLPWTTEAR